MIRKRARFAIDRTMGDIPSQADEYYRKYADPLNVNQVPIIYHEGTGTKLWGLEKLQPFDVKKYQNVYEGLTIKYGLLKAEQIVRTISLPSEEEINSIHKPEHLAMLSTSHGISRVCDSFMMALIPHPKLQQKLLIPMKIAMAGTILATHLAMKRGWSLNLGGGFHHCSPELPRLFCFYGDIPLSWKLAKEVYPQLQKAMYIDFDVHQGNGFERFWKDSPDVYILDAYNHQIIPGDEEAKAAIKTKIEFKSGIKDEEYLSLISNGLEKAFSEFQPDIIYYNAGIDVLEDDRLGQCKVSTNAILVREERVFMHAMTRKIPIVMIPSGGYSYTAADTLVKTIIHLREKFNLF